MGGGKKLSEDRPAAWTRSRLRMRPGFIGLAFVVLALPWPCVVWAQEGAPPLEAGGQPTYREESMEEVPFEADIGLDQLLQLPAEAAYGGDVRQGASARTWRRRFAEAAEAVTAAQGRIDEARAALDEMSSVGGASQWQMAPPGANASTDVAPMSLKHREAIRSGKEELAQAERNQRALVIEADLAGVPQSWRVPLDGRD